MKPFEICEDIYQIGGPYLSDPDDCSVYLVRSEPQLVLIDCGAGRSFEVLLGKPSEEHHEQGEGI